MKKPQEKKKMKKKYVITKLKINEKNSRKKSERETFNLHVWGPLWWPWCSLMVRAYYIFTKWSSFTVSLHISESTYAYCMCNFYLSFFHPLYHVNLTFLSVMLVCSSVTRVLSLTDWSQIGFMHTHNNQMLHALCCCVMARESWMMSFTEP